MEYLKEEIKRITEANKYYEKMIVTKTEARREYYRQGAEMFLKRDEVVDLIPNELQELKDNYKIRKEHVDKLFMEAKQIKHLVI